MGYVFCLLLLQGTKQSFSENAVLLNLTYPGSHNSHTTDILSQMILGCEGLTCML
jgi:hypothetical protein